MKHVVLSNQTQDKRVNFYHPLTRNPLFLGPNTFLSIEEKVNAERMPFFQRLSNLSLTVDAVDNLDEKDELIAQLKNKGLKGNYKMQENKNIPNDLNPQIPDNAPVGTSLGRVEDDFTTGQSIAEIRSAVGTDESSKNEGVPNDLNPEIPAGAPEGKSLGKVEHDITGGQSIEEIRSAVGTDTETDGEGVPNDLNPEIPSGAPEGKSLGKGETVDKPVETLVPENTVISIEGKNIAVNAKSEGEKSVDRKTKSRVK